MRFHNVLIGMSFFASQLLLGIASAEGASEISITGFPFSPGWHEKLTVG